MVLSCQHFYSAIAHIKWNQTLVILNFNIRLELHFVVYWVDTSHLNACMYIYVCMYICMYAYMYVFNRVSRAALPQKWLNFCMCRIISLFLHFSLSRLKSIKRRVRYELLDEAFQRCTTLCTKMKEEYPAKSVWKSASRTTGGIIRRLPFHLPVSLGL